MLMPPVLIDTDILSAIMRSNASVLLNARKYLSVHGKFTISIITRYEILRGLKAKQAHRQLAVFERFCERCSILPITDDVIVRAADIYAILKQKGMLISDADILIAASALINGFGVVTNNEEHFKRIPLLRVENWFGEDAFYST